MIQKYSKSKILLKKSTKKVRNHSKSNGYLKKYKSAQKVSLPKKATKKSCSKYINTETLNEEVPLIHKMWIKRQFF